MTTTHPTHTTPSAGHTPPGALERIVNVARLHLVNRSAVIWLPLFILSVIFTFSLILWWIIAVLFDRAVDEVAEATFTDSWPSVGAWLVQNGAVGVAAWSIVPTLLAAVTGFFILRRATPK